jgi:hypothetical protein
MAKRKGPDLTDDELEVAKGIGMSPGEYAAFKTDEGARAWERKQHRRRLRERVREVLEDEE